MSIPDLTGIPKRFLNQKEPYNDETIYFLLNSMHVNDKDTPFASLPDELNKIDIKDYESYLTHNQFAKKVGYWGTYNKYQILHYGIQEWKRLKLKLRK